MVDIDGNIDGNVETSSQICVAKDDVEERTYCVHATTVGGTKDTKSNKIAFIIAASTGDRIRYI